MKSSLAHTVAVPNLDHDAMMETRFGRKVSANGRLERRIVAALLSHLELAGFEPRGVWDGEEFTKATTAKAAMELIFNLDEASLRIKSGDSWHGILLVVGNGVDILSDWNYFSDDRDGFNSTMEKFDADQFA